MATDESEFQKLLSEAPMASSADTVTVMGALSRTADPGHFMLTLPDGRSETLEVAAVKSAKKIASAVGQSLVELELDAKKIPESVRDFYIGRLGTTIEDLISTLVADHTGVRDLHSTEISADQHGTGFSEHTTPFVSAMPHHVDPATRAALEFSAGIRTYYSANNWTGDQHHIMKAKADPQ